MAWFFFAKSVEMSLQDFIMVFMPVRAARWAIFLLTFLLMKCSSSPHWGKGVTLPKKKKNWCSSLLNMKNFRSCREQANHLGIYSIFQTLRYFLFPPFVQSCLTWSAQQRTRTGSRGGKDHVTQDMCMLIALRDSGCELSPGLGHRTKQRWKSSSLPQGKPELNMYVLNL